MMEIKIGYLLLSADLHQPGDVDITLTTGDGVHLIGKEETGKEQEEEKILNDWIIKMATIRGSLG